MTTLQVSRLSLSKKGPVVQLDLRPGIHAVMTEEADHAQVLLERLSGITASRRAHVALAGVDPARHPGTRARVGSLLPREPELRLGETVRDHACAALALHGLENAAAVAHLEAWLTEGLLATPSQLVSPLARREVALAMAMAINEPLALLLHEPLLACPAERQTLLLARLHELSRRQIVIVCVVESERSAARLSGHVYDLTHRRGMTSQRQSLLLRVERPREIAALLAHHEAVLGTRLDANRPRELLVEGIDRNALCQAATDAVVAARCELFEMTILRSSPRLTSPVRTPLTESPV